MTRARGQAIFGTRAMSLFSCPPKRRRTVNENFPARGKPRLRRLSAEEIELWLTVTRGVARRPGSGSPQLPQPRKDAELQLGEAGNNLPKGGSAKTPSSPAERKAPPPLAPLERRLRQKLARGRAAPDA